MKKKAIVLGLGKSGVSALSLLTKNDFQVIGIDDCLSEDAFNEKKKSLIPAKIQRTIKDADLNDCSFIVISPGISWTHPLILQACKKQVEIIGEVELAFRIHQPSALCIGITGTNGKTTVTLLVEHILKSNGINALAVGNIGVSLSSAFSARNIDVFVIELSSFQLETLSHQSLDFGLLLNISPDHLDRYDNFESYAKMKLKILDLIKEEGFGFLNEHISYNKRKNICSYGFNNNNDIYYHNGKIFVHNQLWAQEKELEHFNYNHDLENILAAISICQKFPISSDKIMESIKNFRKPSHRIEIVRNLNGVVYYNDSKGTNIDAVIKAVESIKKNIILICGGVDKGSSYNIWRSAFIGKVKSIFIIGQAAKKISNELYDLFSVEIVQTLEEAVSLAYATSKNGDSVLLSPGCSSYDMFLNYEHRGNEFVRIVNSLPNREKL